MISPDFGKFLVYLWSCKSQKLSRKTLFKKKHLTTVSVKYGTLRFTWVQNWTKSRTSWFLLKTDPSGHWGCASYLPFPSGHNSSLTQTSALPWLHSPLPEMDNKYKKKKKRRQRLSDRTPYIADVLVAWWIRGVFRDYGVTAGKKKWCEYAVLFVNLWF